MNKRDLKADLELCNKATEGPWEHRWNPDVSEIYAPGVGRPIILAGHNPRDADFIAQAREGWPHAIERAIEAEATLQELIDTLDANIWVLCVCTETDESEQARVNIKSALNNAKEVLNAD